MLIINRAPQKGLALSPLSLLVAAIFVASGAPTAQHQWKEVHNATFNYSACYPADLLGPSGDPLNIGGQRYVGKGGAQLVISGLANPDGDNLQVTAEQTIPNSFGLKRKVTYKALRRDWAVLSGQLADGRIFYQRVIRKRGNFAFFFLSYPKNQSATFDPVVKRLGTCLR